MNIDGKKTPSKTWILKLFRQKSPAVEKSCKTYFAHRYHHESAELPQNPFRIVFSGDASEGVAEQNHSLPLWENANPPTSVDSTMASIVPVHQASSDHSHTDPNVTATFTVLNCYDETPDTKTFRLGRLNTSIFNYLPGQYITLSVSVDGKEFKRSYSLASTPSNSGIIDITVKRDPNGGVVSNWLNSYLKPGDDIGVKGPYGKFTCAPEVPAKILFLAAGSGIVPIVSMLRWLTGIEAQTDIVVLLTFRTLSDIIYRHELDLITARHNNIRLFITLTQEPPTLNRWQGFTGRIDKNRIAALVPDLPERTAYTCGPEAFMAECKQALLSLKLPPEKFFCESFNVNNTAISQSGDNQPNIRKTGNYLVTFGKSRKTINTDGTINLLTLAEKSGIEIPHECRAGECGECMVKSLKGRLQMTQEAEISEADRKKGWVYACCAYPVSDAVLDA